MNWLLIFEILYVLMIILVCIRIIRDTQNTTKTLAYILLAIFVPFFGVIFYFSFGINYRKRKIYSKKIFRDAEMKNLLYGRAFEVSNRILNGNSDEVQHFRKLGSMIFNESSSPMMDGNRVEILFNGENKFPEVFKTIDAAQNHIHIEYYIFNSDIIGNKMIELLIKKAREGVSVRFIYDDFGSRSIRKDQVNRLREAGVAAFPFYKIKLIAFANRLNYRNHRKIIIVDGKAGFVGGINVSDKYINPQTSSPPLYWRDTHLKIEGPAVSVLQYIFLGDWNYCAEKWLQPTEEFFPDIDSLRQEDNKIVQLVSSGPDSNTPLIQWSLNQVVHQAKEELLITTPYFIPGESLMDSLAIAAFSGVKVKLLVPGISDSHLVNYAAQSYYGRILKAGGEIYRYQKGFVHAKTLVADGKLAMVGTANMDIRSFDLNFETNAIVYDKEIAAGLRTAFYQDLKDSEKIDFEQWETRSSWTKMIEKTAGLFSPML